MAFQNQSFTFDDILLIPAYNHYESRRLVDISMADKTGHLKLELPVFTANMDTITEYKMANLIGSKGGMGILHRFMSIEENVIQFKQCKHKTFVSIGCSKEALERAEALHQAGAEFYCIDVAHAHAKYVGQTLKQLKLLIPNACVMAGNVATYAGADFLASCGADIIKVGIGGGSVCTTRIKTGFGVPTLYSVQQCARVDRSIVADGGIRSPGDIVKALAFGADFVILGGMLAGTVSTPGEVMVNASGEKVKAYRGMASFDAQKKFMGEMPEWRTAEGAATTVPFVENEEGIIADIIGGLRSGLTYAGAATIRELQRKLDFTLITPAARIESLPHKTFKA